MQPYRNQVMEISRNFVRFQGSSESRFGGSEKDRYFLEIPKWQHKFVRNYKRGKLVSYFLNNAAKARLYGLKFQRTLELSMFFSLKPFFISLAISTQVASAPLNDKFISGSCLTFSIDKKMIFKYNSGGMQISCF